MTDKQLNIKLPLFTGFNYTAYENEDYLWEIIREDAMVDSPSDLKAEIAKYDVDIDSRRLDICRRFCDVFKSYAPGLILDVMFDSYTDEGDINATVVLSDDWKETMVEFIANNEKWFSDKVKQEWSSDEHKMENTVHGWKKMIEQENVNYIPVMIRYMMENDGITDGDLECNTMLEIDDWDYITKEE